MSNYKFTCIVFGVWIGLALAGSVALELSLQDRVYSDRTVTIVFIMGVSGFFSSALSWRYFTRFERSILHTSLILSLVNVILFCIIGTFVSYIILIVIPHIIEPGTEGEHGAFSIIDFLMGIVLGYLGSGFSFKTFGLPLLWPLGVISGGIGTIIFVYINKMLNSSPRH